jgi:hypothetical protein
MLGVDQGGIEPVRWSNFRPAPTGTMLWLGKTPIALPAGLDDYTTTIDALAEVSQTASHKVIIGGQVVNVNLLTRSGGGSKLWYMSQVVTGSPNGDNDGVREKLRLIAAAINQTAGLPWRAEVWRYHLVIRATGGSVNNIPSSIATTPAVAAFNAAMIANVRQYSLGAANGGAAFTSDGADGTDGNHPEVADYLGDPAQHTGFYALDRVDLFNLMVLAGDDEVPQTTYDQIWGPASVYAASRRAMLLVDPPLTWTAAGLPAVVQNTPLVNDLRSLVVKENAAVFYPRLRYTTGDPVRTIAPAGAIAGVMARIDISRGIWKAPAGLEADIQGIVGLEVKLTDLENGVLNKQGVNVLRVFPSGFTVWGARTLKGSDDQASEWKYIPIRRFALFLEESLFRGTKWVVFEPNDEPLWAQIRLNLNAFMMGLFRQGAFQGSTPKQAFYVKCDAETTTQADRNLGIVNIEVGFAPLKPAEFVIIKIQQIAGDL